MSGAVKWWRDTHTALADKIESGEPLTLADRRRAAAAIRRSAEAPPQEPARGPGKPRTFNHDDAFLLFHALREDPKTWKRDRAIEYVAIVLGAEFGAVEEAIRKFEKKSRG